MTKRKIKIVKRDAPVPEPTPISKPPADPERGMTNTVKNWITERRKNDKTEKASNNRTIFSWTKLPNAAGNTHP